MGDYGFHMGGMWFWWILAVAIILAAIWFGLRRGRMSGPRGDRTPEELLKRRYAQGEITREQYRERLEELRQ
jgi:putative membrane protein